MYKLVSMSRVSTYSRIKAFIRFVLTVSWVIVVLKEKSTLKHNTYDCTEIFRVYLVILALIN